MVLFSPLSKVTSINSLKTSKQSAVNSKQVLMHLFIPAKIALCSLILKVRLFPIIHQQGSRLGVNDLNIRLVMFTQNCTYAYWWK